MYPYTPFKFLADKLVEKFGDHQLSVISPRKQVFDSETPDSVSTG